MKSHYELLGLEAASDAEAIKRAFRREIARYHPDKVSHLGPEFQAIAATKAAELTAAYTTLTNASLRAAYDAALAGGGPLPRPAPGPASAPEPRPEPVAAVVDTASKPERPRGDDRSDIVRRAALGRLRAALAAALPDGTLVSLPGFDLASVPRSKASLFRRTTPPAVLVRLAAVVDKDLVVDAYAHAMKAKVDQKPVVLLLAGDRLAPIGELAQAIDDHRRRNPSLADVLLPVPVDIRDWTARIPANAPPAVKLLIDSLKNFAA